MKRLIALLAALCCLALAVLLAACTRAASPALVETDFAFCNIRKGEEDGSAQ